jgi:hypothetical protein
MDEDKPISVPVRGCPKSVVPDQQGRYHFEEMGYENLPDYLGYLVGYLDGPLAPDEAKHYRKEQVPQEYLCGSVNA